MDVKSEILDHANVQTTLQMYVYPSTTSKRDGMEAASMLAGIAKRFLFLQIWIFLLTNPDRRCYYSATVS